VATTPSTPFPLLNFLISFFRVKLSYDPSADQYVAIKTIKHSHPKLSLKTIRSEIEVLSNLKHPHILNLVEFYEEIDYVKKNGTSYKVVAIVLELIPGGELFEYIVSSGRFSEEIARTYFQVLVKSIPFILFPLSLFFFK